MQPYIARQLRAEQAGREQIISDADVTGLRLPLVILGDPGMGKTRLTEFLAEASTGLRVPAGVFVRAANPARFVPSAGAPLIIDGLDEIASLSGPAAVDAVLIALSKINCPDFVLSCRAADWNGSVDRHKILEDYGRDPTTVQLLPFSRSDAEEFLKTYDGIDAGRVIDELDCRDLADFYGNPLTLTLVAEIVLDHQGLPSSRVDLLDRASKLLLSEKNPAHQRSTAAMASADDLLDAAGAIFAHLLLSGSLGIANRPADATPVGYIPIGDVVDLVTHGLQAAALKTRLFRSLEENLFQPYHRVIAEYLGAKWLSKRVAAGLSERRVLHAITFAGGVPTALRGLYAWLGHFGPAFTPTCIKTDPYGFLRYSDPERLPLESARLLLNSLSELANEDPYFRSEDWGQRAMVGLARPELKAEVLSLLKHPDRHIHLSTVVLEALRVSKLTADIVPELTALVSDTDAAYVERHDAAQALIAAKVDVNWPGIVEDLSKGTAQDQRLAIEVMGLTRADGFDSLQIADLLIDYHGGFSSDRNREHVSGSDYFLLRVLSPAQCAATLDAITQRVLEQKRPSYWHFGYRMSSAIRQLLSKGLQTDLPPSAEQLWRWLQMADDHRGYFEDDRERLSTFFRQHPGLRHQIQRLAFSDNNIEGAPWMTVVAELPRAHHDLAITADDAVIYLDEIHSHPSLSNFDIELWTALVRVTRTRGGFPTSVEDAVKLGIAAHPQLQRLWDEIVSPPTLDWEKREREQRRKADQARRRSFKKTREAYSAQTQDIAAGRHLGALNHIAKAYLNHYSDLDGKLTPVERVQDWLGDAVTIAALDGFLRVLGRNDLPTAKQIADLHAESKEWTVEPAIICGVAETLHRGMPLSSVSRPVLKAALAAWWEFPDHNSQKLGEDLGKKIEDELFSSDSEIRDFLATVMEPRIRAGHEHVNGAYWLSRDPRYSGVAGNLALQWLKAYPDAKPHVQRELLDAVLQYGPMEELRVVARERCASFGDSPSELRSIWMATRFLIDFDDAADQLARFCAEDRNSLWAIRSIIRSGRDERWRRISVAQLVFIIEQFASRWPPEGMPMDGSWGDQNAWDATEFIRSAINATGADNRRAASDALERLVLSSSAGRYRDQIKHVRAQQQRLRRDTEYRVLSIAEVKALLLGGIPQTIDDLRALTLDALGRVQIYLRQSDTQAWKACWEQDIPADENTCRDRILDLLRSYVPQTIALTPETRMPNEKRADIVAHHNGNGVPMEFKGQWHGNVWNASSVQLVEQYAKDWRADGRGIYVVLWCGNVAGKTLPRHPAGLPLPETPGKLQEMLVELIDPAERSRIDVVVIDVSKP